MKKLFNKTMKLCMLLCMLLAASSANAATEGKILCVFGDSYVKNHRCPVEETWHYKAAQQLGMEYANFGRNGSSVLYDRTKDGFGEAMTDRWKMLPEDIDCLLIIAGHNDACMIPDEAGLTDFTKALGTMLAEMQQSYPGTKIGYVLPWNVNRDRFAEVIDIIKKVCAERNVPVFDAEAAGGIKVNDDKFRAKYFQNKGVKDTAHLNAAGHDLIVTKGAEFISSLMGE